ncbi:putative Nose resistant to fluoxetine protein 6 [Hypsibius exemplaris]|uniref:Nose resistant to fluoxetine protein 6 n=1 Tax=Hypsibius exemplaris TaxID=2072580 RepID=A0A1W0X6I4_HYPEX|nr:putative Nose resistant to fluoxetine protein 6 [Hypsibius exemplaris]
MQNQFSIRLTVFVGIIFCQSSCAVETSLEKSLSSFPIAAIQNLLDPLHDGSFLNFTNDSPDIRRVSEPCLFDLVQLGKDLRARKSSAVQMIDSFGKVPSGLIRGHLQWFGAYDECLAVNKSSVNYCLTRLGSSDDLTAIQRSPALGTCLPRTCGSNDIELIVNVLIEAIAKLAKQSIPELDTLRSRSTVCELDNPWEGGAFLIMAVIAIFAVICTFGSILECCPGVTRIGHARRRSTFTRIVEDMEDDPLLTTTTENGETVKIDIEEEVVEEPLAFRAFQSFSFGASWRFFTDERPNEIPYLNGMLVASVWWVLIGKEFSLGELVYENAYDYFDGMKTFLGQLIVSSYLAGDTFLLISGLVLTYTILGRLERNGGRLNWAWLYIRRYLRLTPMYAVLLLGFVFLVPHVVDGPFPLLVGQDIGRNPILFCKQYWWTNMLYINNFVPLDTTQQCMDWTPFLAIEMQLFLITPPLVFLLYKCSKVGLAAIVSLIAGCLVANAVIEAQWGLPIAMFQVPLKHNDTYDPTFDYVGNKPYTRATPYLIGMMLGFLFLKKPVWQFPYPKFDIVFNIGCWISSCIVANKVIFGLYDEAYNSPTAVNMLGRVSWQMLSRLGYSASISWVIFACNYGYAGPIRDILEWKVWRPLSHLTYMVYLFHPLTLQLWLVTQRDPFYFNLINMTSFFFAQLISVYTISFIFGILIEFPLLRLERAIMRF